jgi:hypothetical protein
MWQVSRRICASGDGAPPLKRRRGEPRSRRLSLPRAEGAAPLSGWLHPRRQNAREAASPNGEAATRLRALVASSNRHEDVRQVANVLLGGRLPLAGGPPRTPQLRGAVRYAYCYDRARSCQAPVSDSRRRPAAGKIAVKRRLHRTGALAFFWRQEPSLAGREADAAAHHFAREPVALGHEAKLMPAAYVKAYVKASKTACVACLSHRSAIGADAAPGAQSADPPARHAGQCAARLSGRIRRHRAPRPPPRR